MDINEAAKIAVEFKQQHGCNCCQAVLLALKDQVNMSEEELRRLGAGFGLGLGNMEGTCGALVAAAIIAGFNTNVTKAAVRELNERFKEMCGAITCEDIKGRYTGKILCSCDDCVKNAVLAYGEMLEKM
ncbi:MAG: C-GCAxxG-C-C family protein [Clostridia bacterium]|nr:C-GCAxxG-C-C family protein [Clostridia bacterium]